MEPREVENAASQREWSNAFVQSGRQKTPIAVMTNEALQAVIAVDVEAPIKRDSRAECAYRSVNFKAS
jgi:hypothetical protein